MQTMTISRHIGMLAILLLLLIAIAPPVAAATTITVGSSSFNTYTDVYVTADSFTSGLSGYSGTLTVADPTKAEILSVTHPSWALIHSTGAVPASSVNITGLDTGSSVQSVAIGTQLVQVRLRGIDSGATTLGVTFASMDDDFGAAIGPATAPGAVTVTVMQGLHFSGAGAPTIAPVTIGQYYDEIEASNLSWAFAIGPIVPEPMVDMFGGGDFGWRVVWFAVFGVMFLILFGRQRNILIPVLMIFLTSFFIIENVPEELRGIITMLTYASFVGIIVYFAISRR